FHVTGVQTCALPISRTGRAAPAAAARPGRTEAALPQPRAPGCADARNRPDPAGDAGAHRLPQPPRRAAGRGLRPAATRRMAAARSEERRVGEEGISE